jgi:hypothetical protein
MLVLGRVSVAQTLLSVLAQEALPDVLNPAPARLTCSPAAVRAVLPETCVYVQGEALNRAG